jgi:hypothetical protein
MNGISLFDSETKVLEHLAIHEINTSSARRGS